MQFLKIDNSVYKLAGESTSQIILPTCKFVGFSQDPDVFLWSIGDIESNYLENRNESSFALATSLSSLNENKISIKVTNLSEGEVVFLPISLTISNSTNGESASATSYNMIYRGNPRTVPISVKNVRNGRLCEFDLYEMTIEKKIYMYNSSMNPIKLKSAGFSNIQDQYKDVSELNKTKTPGTTLGVASSAGSLYPDPYNPQGSPFTEVNPALDRALSDDLRANQPPGYNAPNVPFSPPSRTVLMDFPGRSSHLVQVPLVPGGLTTPTSPGPVAIPYPSCPVCTTSTERNVSTRDEDVCEGGTNQNTISEEKVDIITTTTCP